jgi:hypothetical protein
VEFTQLLLESTWYLCLPSITCPVFSVKLTQVEGEPSATHFEGAHIWGPNVCLTLASGQDGGGELDSRLAFGRER